MKNQLNNCKIFIAGHNGMVGTALKNYLINNNVNKIKQKIYHHYDMILISKDENSHVCFKLNETHMEYYTPFQNKLSLGPYKLHGINVK